MAYSVNTPLKDRENVFMCKSISLHHPEAHRDPEADVDHAHVSG